MSFDIFFQTVRYNGGQVVTKNRFTGQTISEPASDPLTAAELKAVRNVLKQVDAKGPDEFGCYVVQFPDGGAAEVFANELETGGMVALRGMTPDLTRFLFDLLRAGNWVMLPAMEDSVAMTTSPNNITGAPDDFPKIVTVSTADEVDVLLSKGVKAWQKYRDRVMKK